MRCLAAFAALSLLACASSPPGAEATSDDGEGGSGAGGSGGKPRVTDGRGGRPAEAPDAATSAADARTNHGAADAASEDDGPATPDLGAPVGDSGRRDDVVDGPPAPGPGSTCPPDKPYKLCEDFEGGDAG